MSVPSAQKLVRGPSQALDTLVSERPGMLTNRLWHAVVSRVPSQAQAELPTDLFFLIGATGKAPQGNCRLSRLLILLSVSIALLSESGALSQSISDNLFSAYSIFVAEASSSSKLLVSTGQLEYLRAIGEMKSVIAAQSQPAASDLFRNSAHGKLLLCSFTVFS